MIGHLDSRSGPASGPACSWHRPSAEADICADGDTSSEARFRVRPHSSVDLTQHGSDLGLLRTLASPALLEQPTHRRIPSGGPYLPPHAGSQGSADNRSNPPHPPAGLLNGPNGYSSAYNDLEEPAEGSQQWSRQGSAVAISQPGRPMSASSPRFRGRPGARTLSHDSLADPGARALLAELHKVRAAMASGDGGRNNRSGFMTPPPPPPPRTLPLGGHDPLATIERQGSFQASSWPGVIQ